jgi:hypothetical protein
LTRDAASLQRCAGDERTEVLREESHFKAQMFPNDMGSGKKSFYDTTHHVVDILVLPVEL